MGNSEIEGASSLIARLASTVENCQKLADAGYIELLTSSLAASSPGTCEVLAQIASASSDLQERTKAAGAVERLTAILADENLMCKTKEPAQRLLKLLTNRKRTYEVVDLTDSPPEKGNIARDAAGGEGASGGGGASKKQKEDNKKKEVYNRVHCFSSCRAGGRPTCVCGRARFPVDYQVVGISAHSPTHMHNPYMHTCKLSRVLVSKLAPHACVDSCAPGTCADRRESALSNPPSHTPALPPRVFMCFFLRPS